MDFVVVMHADSPFGAYLLQLLNKIGGASGTMDVQGKTHPFIIARELEWGTIGVLQMTHLRNPGMPDESPRRIAVPAASVVVVLEKMSGDQQKAVQQSPSTSLH